MAWNSVDQLSDQSPRVLTLVELLRWRAHYQPDLRAYTFVTYDALPDQVCTFSMLDQRARAIGATLQEALKPGERVLLLYPPGLEYVTAFFGCLYAGMIAVPVYPPHPTRLDHNALRLSAIIRDAQPAAVLTTEAVQPMVERFAALDPGVQGPRCLTTNAVGVEQASAWCEPDVDGDTLAFLQYTSGSTAAPRGVMLTHGNLLHNERMIQEAFEHTADTVVVGWLPLYHDMGLIGNVLQSLYNGNPCILLSPLDFLQQPIRWLQTISKYRATTSGGPNFSYDLCVQRITAEERRKLDLSCWTLAFNGAEPVRAETLDLFAETFAPCGFQREAFYPCFGLAEASLFVTGGPKSAPPVYLTVQKSTLEHHRVAPTSRNSADSQTLVGCGRSWFDETIRIVDPNTLTLCGSDEVGEIWIAGPHVAQGYWRQPAESAATFCASIADEPAELMLRTGDLGVLRDGELFVTGRIKDLIIIAGRNHYPQDIERTVESAHPALRPGCTAAFSIDLDGREQLVVVAEVEREYCPKANQAGANNTSERTLDVNELRAAVSRAVAIRHDIQLHELFLTRTGRIPKTSSGKIQRYASRAGFLARNLPAWDASE